MRTILSEDIIKNYSYGTNSFKKITFVNLLFREKSHFWEMFQNVDFDNFFYYGIEIFKKFFLANNQEKYEDF